MITRPTVNVYDERWAHQWFRPVLETRGDYVQRLQPLRPQLLAMTDDERLRFELIWFGLQMNHTFDVLASDSFGIQFSVFIASNSLLSRNEQQTVWTPYLSEWKREAIIKDIGVDLSFRTIKHLVKFNFCLTFGSIFAVVLHKSRIFLIPNTDSLAENMVFEFGYWIQSEFCTLFRAASLASIASE